MTVAPWSPIAPLSTTTSPGTIRWIATRWGRATVPTPVVVMKSWSAFPRGTTLVSPVTTLTPARSAARRIELHHPAQEGDVQPLLEDEGGGDAERGGTADGEVVDRAVDRQLADVAAGEEERADHERVGGDRDADVVDAGKREHRLVAELVEHGVAEDVAEQRGGQRVAGLPPCAVTHRDRVFTEGRFALANLGDAFEHPLLRVGDSGRRRSDRGAASRLDDCLGHRACTGIGCRSCSATATLECPLPLPFACSPDARTRSRSRAREYLPKL